MACCYAGCTNTRKKNPELTFFRFPKEKERRYLWMKKCNNTSIQNLSFEELQNRVVCEDHFLPKCFDYSVLTSGRTRRSLFKFALPQPASVIEALRNEDDATKKASSRPLPPFPPMLNSPPLSPTGTTQRQKDLVSPQRLMNITENSCPLMRPISPTLSDPEDGNDFPIIPEVTMATPFSPIGESEYDESEEESPSPPLLEDWPEMTTTTTTTNNITTSTITTTTATTTSVTTTTFSTTTMTTKCMQEDSLSSKSANKRSLDSSIGTNEDSNLSEHHTRKYKKILPKSDSANGGAEARILLRTAMENIPPVTETSVSTSTSVQKDSEGSEEVVLNLSSLNIHKLEKTPKGAPAALTTTLYLDNNLIQTLPTIDSYKKLTKVSLANNQIDSLIWFGRLTSLRVLNLSRNKLTDIDGLWKLWHLTRVNLSGNFIQVLRGQSSDPKSNLEFLDISSNKINLIEDLSMLTKLKELQLHQNQIKTLSQCKRHLPTSLTKLTLAENSIINLGDVAELSGLENLRELSLKQNHCINVLQLVDSQNHPFGPPRSFDYRPYVLTWSPALTCLDDRIIIDQERAKAQWLLSQGKIRDISTEKHASLVTYLSEVCPLPTQVQGNISSQSQVHGPIQNQGQGQLHGQVQVAGPMQVDSPPPKSSSVTLPATQSSFSLMKITLPLNNNSAIENNSSVNILKPNNNNRSSGKTTATQPEVGKSDDCSTGGPCKHYIELIEEKAKNYKLQRRNEELQLQNEELLQRIHLLETTLAQNGLQLDDLYVKIEVEDEGLE